ncbi:MAG TPA: hypothetical protein VF144_21025 [Chitinophagaceae bacterium]
MKELDLKNITLIALVISCLLQAGAQLFALSVVVSIITKAPPRSFAMLQGEYGYNSSAFWDTVPMITFLLFIIALITNWKSQRRKLILFALSLFIIAGLVAGFFVEPVFADIIKTGYSDKVDPALQARAKEWYIFDWMVWALGLVAGLILLLALIRPIKVPLQNAAAGK